MSLLDATTALPSAGVHVLEASAGTGKTFAVATLHARWIIEGGLPLSRVLVVTYTEAATGELRERLRERLRAARDALEVAGTAAAAGTPAPDDGPGLRALRPSLAAAFAREGGAALRARLRRAVEDMDLAPIHTIHAFCQRALAEHALAAGQPLAPPETVANEAALRREVALEFWRRAAVSAPEAEALMRLWKSPDALAKALPGLLAPDRLEPAPPGLDEAATEAGLRAARGALAAAFAAHGADARLALREAFAQKRVNATTSKDAAVDPVWAAIEAWLGDPLDADPAHGNVWRYGQLALDGKANKGKAAPTSPLFAAVDAWTAARAAHDAACRAGAIRIAHAVRGFAAQRLPALKRERGLIGFDDMIAAVDAALDAPGGAFAEALRRQHAVALVDEFQDTDARQWRIFRRLFATPAAGEARALVLVGDPKQAIYGFRGGDVDTYLDARAEASTRESLDRNHRSRPVALRALEALFRLGGGTGAFRREGIDFVPVAPGGECADDAWRLDGAVAPGIVVQALELEGDATVEATRAQAARRCAAAIARLLAAGRAGRAIVATGGATRALAPRDVTVLVPRHDDALRMQRALADAGVASVSAGRASVYATDEALDLHAWLAALRAPADDGRLRASLATPLFGLDAATLAGIDADAAALRGWQERLQQWAETVRRHGPLATLGPLLAAQAPRLLAQEGGERRVANLRQLGEELQLAHAARPGLAALQAELERRIAGADPDEPGEQLRLDSDAGCVRVMTLHACKGLTLDLVFVPFAALAPGERNDDPLRIARHRDGAARVATLFADKDGPAALAAQQERRAEGVRLLYVALTRARLATWVAFGAAGDVAKTALAWLLHRDGDAMTNDLDVPGRLRAWQAAAGGAVALETGEGEVVPAAPATTSLAPPPALVPRRALHRDWWVYSFSQLARQDAGAVEEIPRAADDEPEAAALPGSRFAGTRFGNVLHAALERVEFAAWRDWQGELPPPGQVAPIESALRDGGYASGADHDEGVPLLTGLVARTLNAPLPEGTRLADLAPGARAIELEFHLAFAPVAVPALLATLQAHGVLPDRRGFGARARLEGLLTGRIDLVYVAGGRWHVLDYKSNRLPDYGPVALARAVREGEYDLQYVLYVLALHRWLRFRLGAAYVPERDLGGVRYVFCRGLDPADPARPGVFAPDVPVALVRALDDLMRAPDA